VSDEKKWVGFDCVHYYSLGDRFFGRAAELAELDGWLKGDAAEISVRCLCALGGGGKSALAWTWLQRALPSLRDAGYRGAFWCSFYEKDFDFSDFLRRALVFAGAGAFTLADVTGMPRAVVEERLLALMADEPFIFVVDGLERLMNGYAIVFDRAVDPDSLQRGKQQEQVTPYDRSMTDPRTGAFLRRLARRMASRVLVTTRLAPAELDDPASGRELPHVKFTQLGGLAPKETEDLWKSIVTDGAVTNDLRLVFTMTGNHPLVISILARSVTAAGSDWDTWKGQERHRDFKLRPTDSEAEVRANVIGTCMRDLDERSYDVLGTLTTSGKPMPLPTLAQLLLYGSSLDGDDRWSSQDQVSLEVERLVSLGFVGAGKVQDQREFDVHPVVRGAAWNLITDPRRERILTHSLSEFSATPDRQDQGADLNKAMSLFRLLVKTGQIDRGWEMYFNKLWLPLAARSDNRTLLDLFELMLPQHNPLQLLPLRSRREQGNATEMLGSLLMSAGDGDRADLLLRWCGAIRLQLGDFIGFLNARHHRTWQTMYEGRLFDTEVELRRMRLDAARFRAYEILATIDCWIGIILALRGEPGAARERFARARGANISYRWWAQGLAEGHVYLNEPDQALRWIEAAEKVPLPPSESRMQQAWELLTRGMAYHQKGEHEKALDDLAKAKEDSAHANYAVIQCFAIPHIAEVFLEQKNVAEADALIETYFRDDAKGVGTLAAADALSVRANQYRLASADAWRIRARCRLARGDRARAGEYAATAYQQAACDGPPFVYKEGLRRSLETLEACGAYVPRTEARLDPNWREVLARLDELEAEEEAGSEEGGDDVLRFATREEARNYIQQMGFMLDASPDDRRWWAEITKDAPAQIEIPLADAMTTLGISLESFRSAYEKSQYKSILIVFHSLYAQSIVRADVLRTVAVLEESARQQWLDSAEVVRQVEHFLSTEHARRVALTFEFHSLDKIGINAFLADDQRRIAWDANPVAKAWWERLEAAYTPMAMLVLAEAVFLAGSLLEEMVDSIAAGTPRGIEYAFAALRLKRAVAEETIDVVSDTEGWTEVQIFLRLEDVKQRLGWRDASKEAREIWISLEKAERHRLAYVVRVAEELAIRRATVEDYCRASLLTATKNVQANLAYVDYLRLKDVPWDGGPSHGGRQLFPDGVKVTFADTSTWSEARIRGRLEGLKKKIKAGTDNVAEAVEWWTGIERMHSTAVLLRIAEELDARLAIVSEIYNASTEGKTQNIAAALAYLDSTRARLFEEAQAQRRADAHNAEGLAHQNEGRYAEAVASYEAAIAECPSNVTYYVNIADAWKAAPEPEPAQRFDRAIQALERGLAKMPKSERLTTAIKKTRLQKPMVVRGAQRRILDNYHAVTSLAVEVAASLIPFVEERGGSVFDGIAPMRERLQSTMGIAPPGIRFRGNETDMPPDSYLLMLDEVPLVLATVSKVDGRLVDPTSTILAAIESFIRRNLSHFVTHDSVIDLLEKEKDDSARRVIVTIAEYPALFSRLVRLFKALLEENVPIIPLPALCRALLDDFGQQGTLDSLLQACRMLPEIRPQLPGLAGGTLIGVHADVEGRIVAGLRPCGDEHLVLLEPEQTQTILSAFRVTIGEVKTEEKPPAVAVVESALARRYFRKLTELEFPDLIVLAKGELSPDKREIEKTVSFD
jgi:tetratricopeptide (TPR) repeat protein